VIPVTSFPNSPTSPTLSTLIQALDDATDLAAPARPAAVARALQPFLTRPDLLTATHRRSAADGYRTNVVHVHPTGCYSVVALVWRPGQRTAIHSHASWCVVGVHRGRELERSFRRLDDDRVVEVARRPMAAGEVAWLQEGDDDIHDVANAAEDITISIHVYGLDYRSRGSSIATTFTEAVPIAA
jgi:predicted metal-dependent enzyme (double-stranded beta helix superfamily)